MASINRTIKDELSPLIIRGVQAVLLISMILCIAGGVKGSKTLPLVVQSSTKIGVALFIVCFIGTVLVTLRTLLRVTHAEHGEKRLAFVVAGSLPFIFVRLLYSCLSTFANNPNFKFLTGSVTLLLAMTLIEEIIVTAAYIIVGLTRKVIPKGQRKPVHPDSFAAQSGWRANFFHGDVVHPRYVKEDENYEDRL